MTGNHKDDRQANKLTIFLSNNCKSLKNWLPVSFNEDLTKKEHIS
jgi:hypothetical protein